MTAERQVGRSRAPRALTVHAPAVPISPEPIRWFDPLALSLAAVVGAFLLVTPLAIWDGYPEAQLVEAPQQLLFPFVSGVLVVAAVAVCHRFPVLATAVILAPFAMTVWTRWFIWGWLLALIAVMVIVAFRRGWADSLVPAAATVLVTAWYCWTGIVAMLPIGPVTSGGTEGGGLVTFALYMVAIGAAAAVALAARAAARATVGEREATAQRDAADAVANLAAERARMARDLHDVVAHHISLIAVRTESAPFQQDVDAPTQRLLTEIGDDARAALAELRHALAVLRRTDDAPDTRPQPGAADVGGLVVQAREAGQTVSVDGDWGAVDAARGYVLYRAVQEALTNARRHAPGEPVTIRRARTPAGVAVVVTNPAGVAAGPLPRGRGLIGMAERVAALGGEMSADADGGLVTVSIALPWSEATS